MNGDAKASLAILQHVHGWTAKQEISVDVYQKISVLTALEEARARVIKGVIIDEAPSRSSKMELLTTDDEETSNGY